MRHSRCVHTTTTDMWAGEQLGNWRCLWTVGKFTLFYRGGASLASWIASAIPQQETSNFTAQFTSKESPSYGIALLLPMQYLHVRYEIECQARQGVNWQSKIWRREKKSAWVVFDIENILIHVALFIACPVLKSPIFLGGTLIDLWQVFSALLQLPQNAWNTKNTYLSSLLQKPRFSSPRHLGLKDRAWAERKV